MTLLLATLITAAAGAMLAAPEATMTTLSLLAAGIGIALHALLPPPPEETTEAVLLAAFTAM